MGEMLEIERCFLCDEPTGKAGRLDDSLYDEDGYGPYCEECFNTVTVKDAPEGKEKENARI